MMQSRCSLLGFGAALLVSCGVGTLDDDGEDFWSETSEDDERDDSAALGANKRVAIHPGPSDHAELVDTLPVGRSEGGATRRIVMRLGPGQLPKLAKGDRLITPAEVQVTTRCDVGQTAGGCNYNPNVRAQLILTGNPGDTAPAGGGSKALTSAETQSCTKGEHHCKFVFRPSQANHVLDGGFELPCLASDSCHVNLVMWAWHADARSGGQDKVLVGSNDGNYLENGRVDGDHGRLMVIRERGIVAADRGMRETSGGGGITIPTNANPILIYSHRLKQGDLVANEQFLVEAKLVTEVISRARFSTLMFLTKDPKATDGNGLDKTTPSAISEHNGINCTTGTSPCTTHKVGVFRVDQDLSGPVYVNIVAKSAVPGGGSAKVTVKRNDGWLRSVRYRAAYAP